MAYQTTQVPAATGRMMNQAGMSQMGLSQQNMGQMGMDPSVQR